MCSGARLHRRLLLGDLPSDNPAWQHAKPWCADTRAAQRDREPIGGPKPGPRRKTGTEDSPVG